MLATRGRADRPWRLARGMRGERRGRVPWRRAGRAALVLGLLALVIAWPRLGPSAPRLPSDAGIPVAPPQARAGGPADDRQDAESRGAERGGSSTGRAMERGRRVERERAEARRRAAERSGRAERSRRAEQRRQAGRRRQAVRRRQAERRRQAVRRRRVERRRQPERMRRVERTVETERRAEARRRTQPHPTGTPDPPAPAPPRRPAPPETPTFRPTDPATTEFSFERG
jgi:hypothetical protein